VLKGPECCAGSLADWMQLLAKGIAERQRRVLNVDSLCRNLDRVWCVVEKSSLEERK
jgi:hypothetical protein